MGLQWFQDKGTCSDSLCPSLSNNETPSTKCDEDAKLHKIRAIFNLYSEDKQKLLFNIKHALNYHLPVTVGVAIYESFINETVSKTGYVPIPDITKEELLGYKELTILGFDPSKDSFIIANTWGTKWANKGFCLMKSKYFTNEKLMFECLAFSSTVKLVQPPSDPLSQGWKDMKDEVEVKKEDKKEEDKGKKDAEPIVEIKELIDQPKNTLLPPPPEVMMSLPPPRPPTNSAEFEKYYELKNVLIPQLRKLIEQAVQLAQVNKDLTEKLMKYFSDM